MLARLMLVGLALICAAIVFFLAAGRLHGVPVLETSLLLAAPAAASLAALHIALRRSDQAVRAVAWEFAALAGSVVVVEAMIAVWAPYVPSTQLARKNTADKLGIAFDFRTKSQVVEDLAARGIDALPGISREWPQLAEVRQQLPPGLFPLSNASHTRVVECNETGKYLEFVSDEFGFRNPPGLLASRSVDIAAVGASFALGHCIPVEQTLVGVIRGVFPRTASVAVAGGETLSILATFREFVEPLRPPVVLWVMHPNTADTADEERDPILLRYLDPAFSQRLVGRQAEIDAAWRALAIPVQHEFDRRSLASIRAAEDARFRRIPFLPQLRDRVQIAKSADGPTSSDLDVLLKALTIAKTATQSWGGRFVVVIMPLYQDVVAGQLPPALRHAALAGVIQAADFRVIDGGALFARQRDPAGLYTMRINNHPTAEGYRLLGMDVVARLERWHPDTLAALRRSHRTDPAQWSSREPRTADPTHRESIHRRVRSPGPVSG